MDRRWGRLGGAGAAALLLVGLMAGVAIPSTVLRFGPDEMTDRANVIFHGRCLASEARRGDNGAIVTDYRFEVTEFLKGARGRHLAFTAYGGVLGDRGTAIAGAPVFEPGEEVLVFLDTINRAGHRQVIGLSQGKYTIREVDGQRLAFRDLEGLTFQDPATGALEDAEPEQGVPFRDLLERVKSRIAETERRSDGG